MYFFLLVICVWSCIRITFSMILEIVERFGVGQ